MELTGFFEIHSEGPGREQAGAGVETSGYSVRLGWMQGTLYLVDLGSAGPILVNASPVDPGRPVAIQAGDRITMGNTHLTWQAGVVSALPGQEQERPRFSRVTVMLPKEEDEPSGPATLAEPTLPPQERDEPSRVQAADETLLTPKRPASPIEAQALDETLLVPKRPATPVEAQDPDETLLAPKKITKPAQPESPPEHERPPEERDQPVQAGAEDETLLAPKQVADPIRAEALDPTLLAPKGAAPPPLPRTLQEQPAVPGEPAQVPDAELTYDTAWVDMAQLLADDTGVEFEGTTILRDTQTPHLVIHLPDRTWEVPLTKERVTLGRSGENDIPIPDDSLSRRHATIERRGDDFVILDAQSTNGVWLGKQRVEQHRLGTGDALSLGRAKVVFKGGFTSDDLTLIRLPRLGSKPARRPVVFVPGLMGSELWIGSEQVWPSPKYLISQPEIFRLPSDPRIEVRNIVSDVVIVPNIIKLRQYSGLGDYLETGLGYKRGRDLLEFAYDWRQDVRLAAQGLAEAVERWNVQAPVTIIAHSLGTLVTRYYVERLGGKGSVERIILMGGPHYGTPGGLSALLTGPGMLPFGMGDERLRDVLSTFPSAYQILPTYPSVTDQHGTYIDMLNDELWLPEHQRPLLRAARSFRHELGQLSSVPTVSIFGYGLKTKLHAKIHRRADGLWQQVEFTEDTAGDSSVPSGSAVLKESEIHPVFQDHGSLYVDDDVRMRLKVELTRSTTWRRRK